MFKLADLTPDLWQVVRIKRNPVLQQQRAAAAVSTEISKTTISQVRANSPVLGCTLAGGKRSVSNQAGVASYQPTTLSISVAISNNSISRHRLPTIYLSVDHSVFATGITRMSTRLKGMVCFATHEDRACHQRQLRSKLTMSKRTCCSNWQSHIPRF